MLEKDKFRFTRRSRRNSDASISHDPLSVLAFKSLLLPFSIDRGGDPLLSDTKEATTSLVSSNFFSPSGAGASKIMAMHTLALTFYPQTLLIHPRKFSQVRYLLLTYPERSGIHCAGKIPPRICFVWPAFPCAKNSRRLNWTTGSMADGNQPNSPESSTSSATRLIRTIQSFQTKLSARIKLLRKGIWIKIFFFLIGFYSATAFATVIGQTGDWDILSAGLAVVVVEGIGALMYRASLTFVDKFKSLVTVFNYWKAGLSLGLFLDAFKYEIESRIESCKPSNFEIDIFPVIW